MSSSEVPVANTNTNVGESKPKVATTTTTAATTSGEQVAKTTTTAAAPTPTPKPSVSNTTVAATKPSKQSKPVKVEKYSTKSSTKSSKNRSQQRSTAQTPGVPKVKDALGYLEKVRLKFANKPHVYNMFLDIMKEFKAQSIDTDGVIERVKSLFRGHRGLILGFNQFLPPGYKVDMPAQPEKQKQPTSEFNHAVQYVAKIKNRFRDQPEIYGDFLDILHDYQEKRTIDEVYRRVQKLFGGHHDLLDEFKYFLPDNGIHHTENVKRTRNKVKRTKEKTTRSYKRRSKEEREDKKEAAQASAAGGTSHKQRDKLRFTVTYPPGTERDLAVLEKIKLAVNKSTWIQMLRCMNLLNLDIITRAQMFRMLDDVFEGKHADLLDRLKTVCNYDQWEEDQYLSKTMTDYDAFVATRLKSCKQPTPSYRELPGELPVPLCSGRTQLCGSVLNDSCISICSGSEDFSFKSTRKNIYEENLFKVEDERFELDMVIENNAAAIRVLEPMERDVSMMSTVEGQQMKLPPSVDIMHIRAIARIYGDHGYEMIELLKRSPATAVPVIVRRLKQKDREWRRLRLELKNQWRRVCEQNYHKSLDHRSFYFKQEDRRRLSSKALTEELVEAHKNLFGARDATKQDDDDEEDLLTPIAQSLPKAGLSEPFYTYCMKMPFDDDTIHQQVYDLVTWVAMNNFSKQDQMKFHIFWKTFLHHFFDITECVVLNASLDSVARIDENGGEGESAVPAPVEPPTKRSTSSGKRGRMRGRGRGGKHSRAAAAAAAASTPTDDYNGENGSRASLPARSVVMPVGDDVSGKPIRVAMQTWAIEEALNPVRRHTRPSHLFFGTSQFYVLFRLYHFLYSRLLTAKRLAEDFRKPSAESKKKPRKRRRDDPVTPEEAYVEVKLLVMELLRGDIDSNRFESECRAFFGAKSYVLFTIDKLIHQLVTHTLTLVNDESALQLEKLYFYESSRPKDVNMSEELSAERARIYLSNCTTVLRGGEEDHCCQIEYFRDTKELGLGLVRDLPSWKTRSITVGWTAYQEQYLNEPASLDNTSVRPPFLARNVPSDAQFGSEEIKACEFSNGLEFRIDVKSFKAFYLEGTEDTFCRKRPHSAIRGNDELTQLRARVVEAMSESANSDAYRAVYDEYKQKLGEAVADGSHVLEVKRKRRKRTLEQLFERHFPGVTPTKDEDIFNTNDRAANGGGGNLMSQLESAADLAQKSNTEGNWLEETNDVVMTDVGDNDNNNTPSPTKDQANA